MPTNTFQNQVTEGIDAVIVDSVLAIRKGLTEAEAKGGTPAASPRSVPVDAEGKIPTLNGTTQKNGHLHVDPDAVAGI